MSARKRPNGAFVLWAWGDREIEDPKRLRNQLLEIAGLGFSGVLVTLNRSRFEFIDPAVLRALAQTSQWARARNIAFWFHADPRQASRSFIRKTGERMQSLVTARELRPADRWSPHNISRVQNDHFELRYSLPRVLKASVLQENAMLFEPVGLERAFLFQKNNGTIIRDTLKDITPVTRFHADLATNTVTVFGSVRVPASEEWWIIAYPKFNTNAYDFSGHENADFLGQFVEDMFDACTHLSGISWGEGGGGYLAGEGRLPVSLSLYNTFKSEYRYDLREVLYSLTLDVDDNSHIPVRKDYYSLLGITIASARSDFHRMVHAFFSGVNLGHHHACSNRTIRTEDRTRGTMNPWKNISADVLFTDDLSKFSDGFSAASLVPKLLMAKSLSSLGAAQRGFFSFTYDGLSENELRHVFDLLSLYSLECLVRPASHGNHVIDRIRSKEWENLFEANEKIHRIRRYTGYKHPEANVAFIYPTETLITEDPGDSRPMVRKIDRLLAGLTLSQIHCDVLSTSMMEKGRLSPLGFTIRKQAYEAIVFPYPRTVSQRNLEIVSALTKRGFPVYFGGYPPRFTDRGKKIPHRFDLVFDMDQRGIGRLQECLRPLFRYPDNALATRIRTENGVLYSVCPLRTGDSVSGEIQAGGRSIVLPRHDQLVILHQDNSGKIERLL